MERQRRSGERLPGLANMAANDEMDTKTANTIILACNAVLSAIGADEQQKKIGELEEIISGVR